MKLSEYKGEKALDILAELIEPASEIMTDKEIVEAVSAGLPRIKIVKPMIKNHKKAVIEILAVLEGEEPGSYAEKVNLFTLPKMLLEMLNDPELMSLFISQGQTREKTSSGSAMGSIEENNQ